jgi:type III pantothenate kinase
VSNQPSPSVFAVDVGNSRIKFGLFARADTSADGLPVCLYASAVSISSAIPWDDVAEWTKQSGSNAVTDIIASSNPRIRQQVVDDWPAKWPSPRIVESPECLPLAIDLPEPEKAGIDRLLNAVAANVIRPESTFAIIVDSGTATTVDVVSAQGTFLGGTILPGFELSARSLHQHTALLPEILMDELNASDIHPLGRNTRDALRSGLLYGQLGAVRELIDRLCQSEPNPFVIVTGGGGELLARYLPIARWEPHLALQGLAITARGTQS